MCVCVYVCIKKLYHEIYEVKCASDIFFVCCEETNAVFLGIAAVACLCSVEQNCIVSEEREDIQNFKRPSL